AAGREDLTDPVGSDPDGALAAGLGQPLPSPAGEIWPDHVVRSELHVDLGENPPPAWTAAAVIIVERPAHEAADRPLRFGVSWRGRWRRGDLTPDDFPSDVVRKTQQVFVGAKLRHRDRHAFSVTPLWDRGVPRRAVPLSALRAGDRSRRCGSGRGGPWASTVWRAGAWGGPGRTARWLRSRRRGAWRCRCGGRTRGGAIRDRARRRACSRP